MEEHTLCPTCMVLISGCSCFIHFWKYIKQMPDENYPLKKRSPFWYLKVTLCVPLMHSSSVTSTAVTKAKTLFLTYRYKHMHGCTWASDKQNSCLLCLTQMDKRTIMQQLLRKGFYQKHSFCKFFLCIFSRVYRCLIV